MCPTAGAGFPRGSTPHSLRASAWLETAPFLIESPGVWQPNASQWRVIWVLALFLVLFWPSHESGSLAIKALNWAVDPMGTLPRIPVEFSFGDGDDPQAVTEHDAKEFEYQRVYDGSKIARLRLRVRDMTDPFDPSTQQQILVGIGVLGSLLIWRLGRSSKA